LRDVPERLSYSTDEHAERFVWNARRHEDHARMGSPLLGPPSERPCSAACRRTLSTNSRSISTLAACCTANSPLLAASGAFSRIIRGHGCHGVPLAPVEDVMIRNPVGRFHPWPVGKSGAARAPRSPREFIGGCNPVTFLRTQPPIGRKPYPTFPTPYHRSTKDADRSP
jgi:hypothetical protein